MVDIWIHILYLCDHLISGTSTEVSVGSNPVRSPSIHGHLVAYEEFIDGEYKIVLYDLDTGQSIEVMPNGSTNQRRPHINGDWLVFDASVNGRGVRDLVL